MKHRSKVKIPGRTIDLLYTNVAETIARERRRLAAIKNEQAEKVRPIKGRKA